MQFEFNGQTGVIKDKVTGERCVIITQARMQEIFSRLSEIFQSGAKVILFEAGKAAGKRFVEETSDITKADKELFLKTVVQRFTDAGLGKIEVVEFNLEEAEVKFRIRNNFFAGLGCEESTYCSCVEGFVSGMYEQIMRKTPKIQKTKCVANGDPYCEWHMSRARK
jgi:predicted hydrocarbon binding protein